MIPQQKDKKSKFIFIYILLFIFITSINNKNFHNKKLFSNNLIFEIDGLSHDDNQKLKRDLININKDNIFKLDKKKLSNKINENNLVLTFLAKKKYPNKINIQITKAKYFGKIYRNGQLYIIGSNGRLINYDANSMNDLPYFYGKFKKEEFLKFSNVVNTIGLKIKDISSFYFFSSGRWDIKFKDGLLLKLPNTDLINVLSRAMLLKNNQNFSNSKIIDLRIKNRIISNGR
ncbi:cell division protein FtsQ/DivIB [Candidatus Pelagibacter bacterium]|nr:cell division protein FtsQ/DivIB [Candidatus Pelagibacter bacterium]